MSGAHVWSALTRDEGASSSRQSPSRPIDRRMIWLVLRRQWRSLRWEACGAWLVMLAGIVYALLQLSTGAVGDFQGRATWNVLIPDVYGVRVYGLPSVHNLAIHGLPVVWTFGAIIALVFAVAVVWLEKSRGALAFTLAGPVRRVEWWMATCIFVLTVPLAAVCVKALLLWTIDAAAGWPIHGVEILSWWGMNLLFDAVLAAAGLFAAAGIGQLVFALVAGVYLCGAPALIGEILRGIGGGLWAVSSQIHQVGGLRAGVIGPVTSGAVVPGNTAAWSGLVHVGSAVIGLSPFAHFSGQSTISYSGQTSTTLPQTGGSLPAGTPISGSASSSTFAIPYETHVHLTVLLVVWFIILAVCFIWLSWRVFRAVPIEQMQDQFAFPAWEVVAVWSLAGFIAFMAAQAATTLADWPYAAIFFAVLAVLGVTLHIILRSLPRGRRGVT